MLNIDGVKTRVKVVFKNVDAGITGVTFNSNRTATVKTGLGDVKIKNAIPENIKP